MRKYRDSLWRVMLGVARQTDRAAGNHLLYKELIRAARQSSLSGATAFQSIGGSFLGIPLRYFDSEIGSNELPVSITVIDAPERIAEWLPEACSLLKGKGVVCVESVNTEELEQLREYTQGLRIEVYTMESVLIEGIPAYQVIADELRRNGAVWVSVTRAMMGFGTARSFHQSGWLRKRQDAPLLITGLAPSGNIDGVSRKIKRFLGGSGYLIATPVRWTTP